MKPLPSTVEELIKELDKTFPNRCPDISESLDMIRYKSGQRSVIEHLLARQHNEDLFYNIVSED